MKLTTKGRFAVTAMVDLAMVPGDEPVTLAEISGRQKISLSYLEQLFGKLRRKALVTSVRGPGGGYRLAKAAAQISIAEIIVAVDEPIDSTQCDGKQNCYENGKCITHDLWVGLNEHISKYLGAISLQQMLDEQQAKREAAPQVRAVHDMRETLAARDAADVPVRRVG